MTRGQDGARAGGDRRTGNGARRRAYRPRVWDGRGGAGGRVVGVGSGSGGLVPVFLSMALSCCAGPQPWCVSRSGVRSFSQRTHNGDGAGSLTGSGWSGTVKGVGPSGPAARPWAAGPASRQDAGKETDSGVD